MFSKLAKGAGKFLGSARGGLLGGALAIGTGAYVGYKGWTGASEEEQQQLASIDESVQSGQISKDEAAKLKEEVVDKTDVKQGSAAGQGLGIAGGSIAGMKLGATVGTLVGGPVGTVVGGALGSVAGGIAGSEVGQAAGEYLVKGYQSMKPIQGTDASKGLVDLTIPIMGHGRLTKEEIEEKIKSGKIDEKMGKKYIDVLESRTKDVSAAPMAMPPSGADSVYSKSSEVADAQRQTPAAAPSQVAINAPQTNIQNSNNYIAKLPPRNTESSWREYDRMKHGFRMA